MCVARIRLIGLISTVGLVVVWGRVAYIQLALGPWHRATRADAEVRTRPIPAPRAIIRAADGTELARDRCDADLAVHYRYLERPLDETWLAEQARSRLTRRERRDPARVAAAVVELRQEIEAAWHSLAELTATDERELDARARVVQRRVTRIVESVNRRRRERWERAVEDSAVSGSTERGDVAETGEDGRILAPASWRRFCGWLADSPPPALLEPSPVSVAEQSHFFALVENISSEVLLQFASQPERFPGVRLEQRIRREYPAGELACSVVGYTEPSDSTDDGGEPLNSGTGQAGVEGFYDRELLGVPGYVREQLCGPGAAPRALGGRAPQSARDVVLTLDLRVQRFAEELLDRAVAQRMESSGTSGQATCGAIVVLDVRTGAVLAAGVAPRFDLNVAARPGSDAALELARRSDSPLFNRIAQMSLPPGSTFKPVTAIAALKAGVDPRESYFCRGYLHQPDRFRCLIYRHFGVGHETVTMTDALVRSCNVYFFQLAEKIGGDDVVRWAASFGFGRTTGIDLAGEEAGNLPAPIRGRRGGRSWPEGEAKGVAIGQGSMSVTPVQIAVMMAAIANGGLRVVPHVRRDAFQPPRPIDGIEFGSDRALGLVRSALAQVVSDTRGTGHEHVHLAELEIAGKTGTAQSGSPLGDHAWFAGFAPAKNPEFAVVVVLEHAGSGGHAAGPLARDLVRRMLDLGCFSAPDTSNRDGVVRSAGPR